MIVKLSNMTKVKDVAGIDISKEFFDVCWLSDGNSEKKLLVMMPKAFRR